MAIAGPPAAQSLCLVEARPAEGAGAVGREPGGVAMPGTSHEIPLWTTVGVPDAEVTVHPFDTEDGLGPAAGGSPDVVLVIHGLTTSSATAVWVHGPGAAEALIAFGRFFLGNLWDVYGPRLGSC